MFIPQQLSLRPSRICLGLMLLAHGLALMGVALASFPPGLKGGLIAALIAAAVFAWRRHALTGHKLRIGQNGQIEIEQDGWQPVAVVGQPMVLPWLAAMTVIAEKGRRRKISVWPDSTDADSLRKLKAWLRWGFDSSSRARHQDRGH